MRVLLWCSQYSIVMASIMSHCYCFWAVCINFNYLKYTTSTAGALLLWYKSAILFSITTNAIVVTFTLVVAVAVSKISIRVQLNVMKI